jgi:hypothetical protein
VPAGAAYGLLLQPPALAAGSLCAMSHQLLAVDPSKLAASLAPLPLFALLGLERRYLVELEAQAPWATGAAAAPAAEGGVAPVHSHSGRIAVTPVVVTAPPVRPAGTSAPPLAGAAPALPLGSPVAMITAAHAAAQQARGGGSAAATLTSPVPAPAAVPIPVPLAASAASAAAGPLAAADDDEDAELTALLLGQPRPVGQPAVAQPAASSGPGLAGSLPLPGHATMASANPVVVHAVPAAAATLPAAVPGSLALGVGGLAVSSAGAGPPPVPVAVRVVSAVPGTVQGAARAGPSVASLPARPSVVLPAKGALASLPPARAPQAAAAPAPAASSSGGSSGLDEETRRLLGLPPLQAPAARGAAPAAVPVGGAPRPVTAGPAGRVAAVTAQLPAKGAGPAQPSPPPSQAAAQSLDEWLGL